MRQRRDLSQATDFDPAGWLARAEAYGYRLDLMPDYAGSLRLSVGQPHGRPPDVPDPIYEFNDVRKNYRQLHDHLLKLGRVHRIPFGPVQKAILRHMKRRGLLYRASNRLAGLRERDVLEAAGERGLIYMGMVPRSLHDEGRAVS